MGTVAKLREFRSARESASEKRVKLTKRVIDGAEPGDKEIWIWDSELRGFGARIKPSGARSYLIQYRDEGGRTRRYTIGRHGVLTADQARRVALGLLADVERGANPSVERKSARNAKSMDQLCVRYLAEHAEVHKKASSAKEDRRLIDKRIRPAIGKMKIDAVLRQDIVKIHSSLSATPYEANRTLALISKVFNLAEIWGLREEGTNPCRLIKRFPETARTRFLSEDELARVGTALAEVDATSSSSSGVTLTIRLLALTGCRLGEILDLRWEDVDLEKGVLMLPDSKTGAKVVPLGDPAINLLRRSVREGIRVVFGKTATDRLSDSTVESAWRRIRKIAGTDARLHDFRHTVGTIAGQMGMNAFAVRDLLGHRTLAMTSRYVGQDLNPMRKSADDVSKRIAAAMERTDPSAG